MCGYVKNVMKPVAIRILKNSCQTPVSMSALSSSGLATNIPNQGSEHFHPVNHLMYPQNHLAISQQNSVPYNSQQVSPVAAVTAHPSKSHMKPLVQPVVYQWPQQSQQLSQNYNMQISPVAAVTASPAGSQPAIYQSSQQSQQLPQKYNNMVQNGNIHISKVKTSLQLPPHWKSAKDEHGHIYYYHAITKITQWEPPSLHDEANPSSTTSDNSKDSLPKIITSNNLEQFECEMSAHVQKCLRILLKTNDSNGKKYNKKELRHLCRKLTKALTSKALRDCKSEEDLELDENVKHKSQKYIFKYMERSHNMFPIVK